MDSEENDPDIGPRERTPTIGSSFAHDETPSPSAQSFPRPDSDAVPTTSVSSSGCASCPSTSQQDQQNQSYIGPFADEAGITKHNFEEENIPLPHCEELKNGLVLELHEHLVKKLSFSAMRFAEFLIELSECPDNNPKAVQVFVTRLIEKEKKICKTQKSKEGQLKLLREAVFQMKRERQSKGPDTPRKRKLRHDLALEKAERRKVSKKLSTVEKSHEKVLHDARCAMAEESRALETAVKEVDEARATNEVLTQNYKRSIDELEKINSSFNPMKDDMEAYKMLYHKQQAKIEALEHKLSSARDNFNVRNINRKIKRQRESNANLKKNRAVMSQTIASLTEELEDTTAKLNETQQKLKELEVGIGSTKQMKDKLRKQKVYFKNRVTQLQSKDCDTDLMALEDRVSFLQQKNDELQSLLDLIEEEKVTTMKDGRYSDAVRETIMALLSMNVSIRKTNSVIRVVLKKMAGKEVERLPSHGTKSQFLLEARHLADLEVAKAMLSNTPEDVLGNCIHGDGTTKHHKKYQNFQVTLPDGTSRTLGLSQMASGDTNAVIEAFQERMGELALAVSCKDGNKDEIFKQLMVTIKSTMTDQGATMPQFSERLEVIRAGLLPEIMQNWELLTDEVKEGTKEFGRFYCKMHPLINFADEVGKVLKSFEDIAASGKNVHTLLTSECGAVRLVRTASKAYHHRGSDKSGVEDAFTAYLSNEYNVSNHLVYYVGNRANILFEAAAVTYFHHQHLINFVSMLPEPNSLLLAVAEDASDKLLQAELWALGIVHKIITGPLWHKVKTAENILAMNKILHQLQTALHSWKDDASGLLKGETAIEDAPISKDEVYDCLFKECTDIEQEAMCIQALELICCAILLILQRQCKDQLPGGRYWNPSAETKAKYESVPSTNMVGERDFACLDMLVREKPSARTVSLEALIMWSNNKTLDWLDSLPPDEKEKYMAEARSHSRHIISYYHDRMKQIKAKRWENLQAKQQQRQEKERTALQNRVKMTEDMTKQGGLWLTAESVDEHVNDLYKREASVDEIRRSVHLQLTFHSKVLGSKSPKREYFQLGTTENGKRRDFTAPEMKNHLIQILHHNKIQTSSDPTILSLQNPAATKNPVSVIQYSSPEERDSSVAAQKAKLLKKIQDEKIKRACSNSQQHLRALLQEPALLVGKQVEHRLCQTADSPPQWYTGTVLAIAKLTTDASKTLYLINYKDEEEEWEFPLLTDLKRKELIILGNLSMNN